ncbi:SulP family inorganic anion transporter [Ravibacter arvi]|uniref:SulP family inorganic anion transporter n=1 Tax=Ravibacter arvi TaxID=2051041 RepID=A0ABP8M5I8_9BACT
MSVNKNKLLSNLKSDFPAGIVVSLVALPLCLGVALASTGRPDLLFSGLIAGIVGGVVVGFTSQSSLGVSGPAAGLVVIVLNAIATLGSFEAFLLAVVLAGLLQILAGFLKAGIIGYYFPSSVIKGMLAAIGLILILKQIPHALGFDAEFMGNQAFDAPEGKNTFTELWYAVKYSTTGAIIISVISLAVLLLFDRPFMKSIQLFKFVPGALIVVLLGIGINLLFGAVAPQLALEGQHLVQLPVAGSAEEFFGFFRLPDWSAFTNPAVYTVAITLAIVASLESLLSVEATDKLDPYKRNTPTNRELIAQGLGNVTSGLIGGLPVTQVIVRSSANVEAGGKTRMATITHGLILLVSVILIPKFLNLIPLSTLAAILLLVGFKLAKPALFKGMYRLGWEQFIPFVVTVTAILMTDLLKGIAIGMVVAVYFILRKNYQHSYSYRKENSQSGDVITLVLSEEVTFLNKGSIGQTLDNLPSDSTVVIDGSRSVDIDYDVLEIIQNFKSHTAPLRNITVHTKGISEVNSVGGH